MDWLLLRTNDYREEMNEHAGSHRHRTSSFINSDDTELYRQDIPCSFRFNLCQLKIKFPTTNILRVWASGHEQRQVTCNFGLGQDQARKVTFVYPSIEGLKYRDYQALKMIRSRRSRNSCCKMFELGNNSYTLSPIDTQRTAVPASHVDSSF